MSCSEGGRWEYNDTVRAFPRNIAGDPHSDRCEVSHVAAMNAVAASQEQEVDLNASQRPEENWNVREALKWEWQTNSSCPLLPFNSNDFCK